MRSTAYYAAFILFDLTLATTLVLAQRTAVTARQPGERVFQSTTTARIPEAMRDHPGLFQRIQQGLAQLRTGPSGAVRSVAGVSSKPYAGDASEVARQFTSEYGAALGLCRDCALTVESAIELDSFSVVRLSQSFLGTPILGAEVSVLVDRYGRVDEFYATGTSFEATDRKWQLGEFRADAIARSAIASTFEALETTARRHWMVVEGTLQPVWAVQVAGLHPNQASLFIISDEGTILEKRDLIHGQAQGYAFPSNPVVGSLSAVSLQNLTDSERLSGTNARVFSYLPALLGLAQPGICSPGTPLTVECPQWATPVKGVYPFQPSDQRFAEVQMYYGIDRIATRFQELGVPRPSRPMNAVVKFARFDSTFGIFVFDNNAFFSPIAFNGEGGLFFYVTSRGYDPAYDSDIIFHEYTHAIVNRFVPSAQQGVTFRALNEAFADYFSDSFLNDPALGEFGARIWGMRLPFVRTADNRNMWPISIVGEEHIDGNIWSGALWDVRKALGADRADRIALGTLARLNGDSEFYEAAIAAAQAANSLYGRTVADQVFAIMNARGLGTRASELASNAISLVSGQVVSRSINGVAPNFSAVLDTQEYRINVPHQATRLNIDVIANGNVRALVRYRAPVYVDNGVAIFDQQTTVGTNISQYLGLDNTPELQKGAYYVVVANTNASAVNYSLRLTVVGGAASAGPAVTLLTPGVRNSGSAPAGPFLASRQFAVDVPQGASRMALSLQGTTDVDLFVNSYQPVTLNNQGLPDADFVQANPARNESLVLDFASLPSLRPGRYYIGVSNFDTSTSEFSVQADISLSPAPQIQVIQAAENNAVSVALRPQSGVPVFSTSQIRFAVPSSTAITRIQVISPQGIDVLVRRASPIQFLNGWPQFDYRFSPTPDDNIYSLSPTSTPALRPDTYYIAIVNYSASSGSASIRVSFEANPTATSPAITSVTAAGDFGGTASFSSGSWLEIKGQRLSETTRVWIGSDFNGLGAPTSLDGVSVSINGRAAYVYYISPTQINVQAPADPTVGSTVSVSVATARGTSTYSANKASLAPGLLAPAAFRINGRQYLAAQFQDTAFVGRPGLIPGVLFRPAKPGDTLVVYGVGFGDVSPSIPPGQIADRANRILAPLSLQFSGRSATLLYSGLSPGFVGLYQFNIVVPEVPNGDAEIRMTVNGTPIPQSLFLTIQR